MNVSGYRRVVLSIMVVALLALTVVACAGTPTATPVPPTATAVPPTATPLPPTATPVPPTAVPVAATAVPAATKPAATSGSAVTSAERELVGNAFMSLSKATSFGMKATVEGTSTSVPFTGDIVMEVSQVPTRTVHIKLADTMELIVVGQEVYVKMGATAWQKSPMPQAQLDQLESSLDFASTVKPEDLAKMEITKVGTEKVDGVDCDVFSVVVSAPQPETTKMWVSKADKMLVKQVVEDATSKITISFYGWNTIKIEAPKLP
jgi:hypothetical protein